MRLKTAVPAAFLAALALVSLGSAQTAFQINGCDAYIEISENSGLENVVLTYTLLRSGENLSDVVEICGEVSDVNVFDSDGTLQYENTFENGRTNVTFSFRDTLNSGDRSTVTIQFAKDVAPAENGELYTVGYWWTSSPMTSRVFVKLPTNSELLSTSADPTSVYTENGALRAKWVKVLENSFETDVGFQLLSVPPEENQDNLDNTDTVPAQPGSSDVSLYIQVTAIVVACLLAGVIILKGRPKKPPQPKATGQKAPLPKLDFDKILQLLSDNERAVVNLLLKQDDVAQKILCDKTGIPKATMSRMVKSLESKKIVKQAGVGAWKRVHLTRWVKQHKGQS